MRERELTVSQKIEGWDPELFLLPLQGRVKVGRSPLLGRWQWDLYPRGRKSPIKLE